MKKDNRVKKFIVSVVVMVVAITICSTFAISYMIISKCEEYMLNDTSALIAANASQLELNINSYLNGIEGNVALLFSDDEAMNYDASTTTLDDYEKINIESSISNRISDLGTLENYGDFCVVYANDNTVGWKSKTTQNMYSDGGIYEDMCSYITNEKTDDGWAFGVQGNYDRMYYVKRYNKNAVIIASFYTRELERTFECPEELEDMTVRLIDTNGYIVYSSEPSEIGTEVSGSDREPLDKGVGVSAFIDNQVIDTGYCNNGWMVMCKISRDEIMGELETIRYQAILFCIFVICTVIVLLIIGGKQLSKPMDGYVDDLSEKAMIDVLSGVMNRRAYEEQVKKCICEGKYPGAAFVMFDVDNFKQVNDTWGHDRGDDIISGMGRLLTNVLVENNEHETFVGRIGGDEFTAYIRLNQDDDKDTVCGLMDKVLEAFAVMFAEEKSIFPISLSAGVCMSSDTETDYLSMYNAADNALYEAKQSGKNRYCMYKEGDKNED